MVVEADAIEIRRSARKELAHASQIARHGRQHGYSHFEVCTRGRLFRARCTEDAGLVRRIRILRNDGLFHWHGAYSGRVRVPGNRGRVLWRAGIDVRLPHANRSLRHLGQHARRDRNSARRRRLFHELDRRSERGGIRISLAGARHDGVPHDPRRWCVFVRSRDHDSLTRKAITRHSIVNRKTPIDAAHRWLGMVRCHHALSQIAERSIKDTGLGLTDFAALEELLHKGPLTITEIQSKVPLALGSMTAAVDRLEKKGLIFRTPSPEDRRAKVLKLRPKGRALVEAAFTRHAADLETAMAVLNQREKRQLQGLLKRVGLFAAAARAAPAAPERT